MALLTDNEVTSYSSITITLKYRHIVSGRDMAVIEMLDIEQKYFFRVSIFSVSEKAILSLISHVLYRCIIQ